MSRGFVFAASCGLVVLGTVAAAAQAPREAREPAGQVEYVTSCASCHGLDGKGGGPVAASLTKQPPDLTRLAARNQGQFPFLRTIQVIDGRQDIAVHGGRDMPIWGDRYTIEAGGDLADEGAVRGRILSLVLYLEQLQGK